MSSWIVAGCAVIAVMVGVATFFLDITGLAITGVALLLCGVILWMQASERAEMLWTLFAASFILSPFADFRLSMGSLEVPASAFFAVLAICMTCIRVVVTRDWRLKDPGILFSLALIFLGYALSFTRVKFLFLSLPALAKWLFHSFLFVSLMSVRNRVWHFRIVLTIILVTGALSLYALFDYFISGGHELNFYAGLGSRSATGQHIALILPLALGAAMLRRLSWSVRFLLWLTVGLSFTALTFSYSRNGWVSSIIAVLVVALSGRRTGRRGTIALSLSLAVLVFLYLGYLAPKEVEERFWSIFSVQESERSDVTNAQRLRLQGRAIKAISEQPIIGAGLGNYAASIDWAFFIGGDRVRFPAYGANPHDFYLMIWAEGGILALAGFIGMLYFITKRVLRGIRESAGTMGAELLRGALGTLVSLCTLLIFTDDFNNTLIWTLLGLAVSGAHVWTMDAGAEEPAEEAASRVKSLALARRRFGVTQSSAYQRTSGTP